MKEKIEEIFKNFSFLKETFFWILVEDANFKDMNELKENNSVCHIKADAVRKVMYIILFRILHLRLYIVDLQN